MTVLASLADFRDVIVIIYGIIGIIFFFVAIVITVALGLTAKGLIKNVNSLIDDSVKPALSSVQDVANTVRGTTDFVGRTTVAPIAKAYGMFAGVKKGASVLSGLKKRGEK
jgi:hypothetical protein